MKLSAATYISIRTQLDAMGYGEEYRWCQNVREPEHADAFAQEAIWVILCSGMKAEIARSIERKIYGAISRGESVSTVFGHHGKAGAIDFIWRCRATLFDGYRSAIDKMAYLQSLPWIGPVTKFHLAKNLGFDVAKPDRWLIRLANWTGETVDGLCQRLAQATGDRVATVDLVLWRACERAILLQDDLGNFELILADLEAVH